jgi:hypothetical protein
MGIWTPTNRSSTPPFGRLGLDSKTKLTGPTGGLAMRSLFIMLAMVPLWE